MALSMGNSFSDLAKAQKEAMDRMMQQEAKYMQQLQNAQGLLGQMGTYSNALGGSGMASMDMATIQKLLGLSTGIGSFSVKSPSIDLKAIEALKTAEPRMVTRRMPDSVSLITAWRAWGVDVSGSEYRLKALGQGHTWDPKKKMEAVCVKTGTQKHPAPHFSCECGIWCFKTLEQLLPALEGYTVQVIGQVSIWGRIIESDRGFRAQYAYPKELWLMDKSQEQLGYIYGVPVRTA